MDKKEQHSEISLITLSNYVRPAVVESKHNNWVLNGKNNEFYQYIIDRDNGSPTNSSINKTYTDLMYGRGLSARNASINIKDWAFLLTVLTPEDTRRVLTDFQRFGEASLQVIRAKKRTNLSRIAHVAKNKVVPSLVNEDGEIEGYWFSNNWKQHTLKENKPVFYPAFGTSKEEIEIYVIRPYRAGKEYFADPDYLAGLPYCEMEEEIANLNINSIKQGLSAGYIINIPDGISWTPEQKDEFERMVKKRLTGSPNASNFILSFNGRDVEVNITPFPVNENIHKQWQFLTEEAKQQILTSHRATSPSIVGIISSSGFSNTADEMDTAEAQLVKRVIQPKQQYILDALEEILTYFKINLDLYFKPFTEEKEEPIVEMSAEDVDPITLQFRTDKGASAEMANALIEFGTDQSEDDWQLLCSSDVEYDTDDAIYSFLELASTGTARPNAKSDQDSKDIVIRYRYVGNPSPQREFCKLMMSANKLYRKEDIIQMGSKAVNPGFGMNGTNTYDIWKWKGGGKLSLAYPNGTCRHKWQREIYLKRGGGVDVNSPLAKTITTAEAKRKGFKVPVNSPDVSLTPHNNLL